MDPQPIAAAPGAGDGGLSLMVWQNSGTDTLNSYESTAG